VFDRELFISRVYERALKGSLKDTVEVLRQQKSRRESVPYPYPVSVEEKQRSVDIDRMIHKDSKRLQRECKILVLGDVDCCQLFLKQMKIREKGRVTGRDLSEYKAVIKDNVWEILDTVRSIIEKTEAELDGTMKEYTQVISQRWRDSTAQDLIISTTVAEALQELWKSVQFSDLLRSSGSGLPRSSE
jgi:guanine nucleotide-binding protein G(i) subunit alpha